MDISTDFLLLFDSLSSDAHSERAELVDSFAALLRRYVALDPRPSDAMEIEGDSDKHNSLTESVTKINKRLEAQGAASLDDGVIRSTMEFFSLIPAIDRDRVVESYSIAFDLLVAFSRGEYLRVKNLSANFSSEDSSMDVVIRSRVQAAALLSSYRTHKVEFLVFRGSPSSSRLPMHKNTVKFPELEIFDPRIGQLVNGLSDQFSWLHLKYTKLDDRSLGALTLIQLGLAEILLELASFPQSQLSDFTTPNSPIKFDLQERFLDRSRSEIVKLIRIFRLYSETEKLSGILPPSLTGDLLQAEVLRRLLNLDLTNPYHNTSSFLEWVASRGQFKDIIRVLRQFTECLFGFFKVEITILGSKGHLTKADLDPTVLAQLTFFSNSFHRLIDMAKSHPKPSDIFLEKLTYCADLDAFYSNPKATSSEGSSPHSQLLKGLKLFKEGNLSAAASILRDVTATLSLDPLKPFALNALGVLYSQEGKDREALEYFKQSFDSGLTSVTLSIEPRPLRLFPDPNTSSSSNTFSPQILEYFCHEALDWSPVFNMAHALERLGDFATAEKLLRLIIQKLQHRPSLSSFKELPLPFIPPIPFNPKATHVRSIGFSLLAKSFHFQVRSSGISEPALFVAIRIRLIGTLLRFAKPGACSEVLREIDEFVRTHPMLKCNELDFLITKLVVKINVAAGHLTEAYDFLRTRLSETLKADLKREALVIFFDGFYEIGMKLWLMEVDLLLTQKVPKLEEAHSELKKIGAIFEIIQNAETSQPLVSQPQEDAMDIDEPSGPQPSSNSRNSEVRLTTKRTKYQAKLFHRFGLLSECFENFEAAVTNYLASINLWPQSLLSIFSYVGLILNLPHDHPLFREHLTQALFLWHKFRPNLIVILPHPKTADLTQFDNVLKTLQERVAGASRYSKSILCPSQYQLLILDFEVVTCLRSLRAAEIERLEIEQRIRTEDFRRANPSPVPSQRPRSSNVLVID